MTTEIKKPVEATERHMPLGGGMMDDQAYLRLVQAQLPPHLQAEANLLEQVKSVYVPCGRDALFADMMGEFITNMIALRDGGRDEGRIFFLTGESGAGKTSVMKHWMRDRNPLKPIHTSIGTIDPTVSVSLSGGAISLKTVGQQIAEAAGYPLNDRRMKQSELWKLLPSVLKSRGVMIVHIDETQHVLRETESDIERKNLAKAIKGMTNFAPWPISFILSGTPVTTEIARLDDQFQRRGRFLALGDLRIPEERGLIEKVMTHMCGAIGMSVDHLLRSDVPDRLAHAAKNRYGLICNVTFLAIQAAVHRNAKKLERDHFAHAYITLSHARGKDGLNPFLTDNWKRLRPGIFLDGDREK